MMIEQTLREGNERGVDILSLVDERAALYLAGNLKLVRSRVNCLYLHPPEYSIIDAQRETLPGEWRHQNSAERWWLDCVWNDSRIESFHPPPAIKRRTSSKRFPFRNYRAYTHRRPSKHFGRCVYCIAQLLRLALFKK